jgi:3-hydroxyacyl-[acyl-carrier-protein] dehydratase
MLGIQEVMELLPHRYPMLLVDRIVEYEANKRCVGLKNVTMNEAFFQGHYPGKPIMPGVLIIEAIAQAGAVILLNDPQYKGLIPVIGAIDEVRFRRPVVPGDQLRSEVELLWIKSRVGRIRGVGIVDGHEVCKLELTFKLVEKDS